MRLNVPDCHGRHRILPGNRFQPDECLNGPIKSWWRVTWSAIPLNSETDTAHGWCAVALYHRFSVQSARDAVPRDLNALATDLLGFPTASGVSTVPNAGGDLVLLPCRH